MQAEAIQAVLEEKLDANALLERYIQQMESEVALGWRSYYADQLWLSEHLPRPLMNEAGRAFTLNNLRGIYTPSAFDRNLTLEYLNENSLPRQTYRNFIEVVASRKTEALQTRTTFLDVAADRIVPALEAEQGESFGVILLNWSRGFELNEAKRALDLYREINIERFEESSISMNFASREMLLCLMEHIAPEWVHAAALSKKKNLVFKKPFTDKFDWIIELYVDGRIAFNCARWGVACTGLRRPLNESNFVDLSFNRAGSSTFGGQTQQIKSSKLYILDDQSSNQFSAWQAGADLMHKIPNFESWMDFFGPLLMPVCA